MIMKKTALLLFVGCAALLDGADMPTGNPADPNQPYDRLPATYVTPHIAWARPNATGPLKTLVISPTWAARETAEFAQRLSMEVSWLMTESHEYFAQYPHEGERGSYNVVKPEVLEKLARERLGDDRHYDLIVIGKVPWTVLPDEVRAAILAKVRNGTGLLVVSSTAENDAVFATAFAAQDQAAKELLLAGVPLHDMPYEADNLGEPLSRDGKCGPMEYRLGRLDKGRIVEINYRDAGALTVTGWKCRVNTAFIALTPYLEHDELFYDYDYSTLARLGLWAARREPEVRITQVDAPTAPVLRDNLPSSFVRFGFQKTTGGAATYDLRYVIRDRQNQVEQTGRGTLKLEGASEYRVPLPSLKQGLHMVDLWVESSGKIVNWGSTAVHVETAELLRGVTLEKDRLKPGEPIRGSVILGGPLPKGTFLQIELKDTFHRLLGSQRLDRADTRVAFTFELAHPLTIVHDITARLMDARGIIEEAAAHCVIPKPADDLFQFPVWTSGVNNLDDNILLDCCARFGVTAVYDTTTTWSPTNLVTQSAVRIARENLRAYPYTYGYWQNSKDGPDGPIGEPCYSDPAFIQSMREDLTRKINACAPYASTLAWSLGEESHLAAKDTCFSPTCLADFREYLRARYPSLDALNTEWGSDYKEWSQVKPATLVEAARQKRDPQWVDHRLHMQDVFARRHEEAIQLIQQLDPGARVGVDCVSFADSRSFDWPRLLKQMGCFSPGSPDLLMEAIGRSFLGKGGLIGCWTGSYTAAMDEETMRYTPWHNLLGGMNQCLWWTLFNNGGGLGGPSAFTPDLSEPLPCFRQASEEVREINGGLGALLLRSKRLEDPIAIHFAPSEFFASVISFKETNWENSLRDFVMACDDAGLGFRMVSPGQIEAGDLTRFKVLMLPFSQALSAKETGAIKEFVNKGGILFADFSPGIMDEHGRKLPKSQLSEVFGAFTPLHVNPYGKGRAICLGDALKGYAGKRMSHQVGGRLGLVRMLQDFADIRPRVRVLDSFGKEFGGLETSSFEYGKAVYLGLLKGLRVRTESDEVKVELPSASYLYDVRAHTLMGCTNQFSTALAPGRAKVFACLPAPVEKLSLALDKAVYGPGDVVHVQVQVLPATLSGCGLAIGLSVSDDKGEPVAYDSQNLISITGQFEGTIPLALNERPGRYHVVVREIASGTEVSQTFQIKEKKP